MSLIKRKHTHRFPSIFDELMTPDWFGGFAVNETTKSLPAVNIKESDVDFTVQVAAPGLKKEDFNIELDNDMLTISSEVKQEQEAQNEKFTRKEFAYHAFKRSFTLPETIDKEGINAGYESGVLVVSLPKLKEAQPQPKRLISIS